MCGTRVRPRWRRAVADTVVAEGWKTHRCRVTGEAEEHGAPICMGGLGTAQAFDTVTVKARVDGQT